MAVNKVQESQLPVRSVSDSDYVRIVGADGKSYRVPKTDFNGGGGGLTYTLSIAANVITLNGSNGSTSSIALPVYNGGVS